MNFFQKHLEEIIAGNIIQVARRDGKARDKEGNIIGGEGKITGRKGTVAGSVGEVR